MVFFPSFFPSIDPFVARRLSCSITFLSTGYLSTNTFCFFLENHVVFFLADHPSARRKLEDLNVFFLS